jgi:hypothetical protein
MTSRRARLALLAAAIAIVACYGLDAPAEGIESLSVVLAPSPSVVVDDDSRDENGLVAPFRVVAFDEHGDTVRDATVTFVALQKGLTFDAQGVAHGDSVVQGGIEVVGTVGPLQTLPLRVPVTVAPLHARKEGEKTVEYVFPERITDTTIAQNQATLRLIVSGAARSGGVPADTFAVGFIVDFEVVDAPDALEDSPTVLITDGVRAMTRDTTDQSGVASRVLQFRPERFGDPQLIAGARPDTARIRATVRYGGGAVAGTPIEFVVPVCKDPVSPTATCASPTSLDVTLRRSAPQH